MGNLDTRTHDPATFNAEDYALECRNGTCDCAPTCPICGKVKLWDAKIWPGYHDWGCGECHNPHFTTPWKANGKRG